MLLLFIIVVIYILKCMCTYKKKNDMWPYIGLIALVLLQRVAGSCSGTPGGGLVCSDYSASSSLCTSIGGCTWTEQVVCATDILECWDGSFLSRDPDNDCEFDECPISSVEGEDQHHQLWYLVFFFIVCFACCRKLFGNTWRWPSL